MTLYHFGNCAALIYVPYYMTYKFSGLSDYGAFWKNASSAGGIYVFVQLCKMLVLATFFDSDAMSTGDFHFFAELLRGVVDFADLLGFYLILSRIPGKGHSKLITAGLGWATAEVVLSRALSLWVGARGAEFSWIYILKCLESNVLLVQHITTATLIWLFTRHDLNKALKPVVTFLLVLTIFKGLWLEGLVNMLAFSPWASIGLKFLVAIVMGISTLHIYTGLAQQIGI